MWLGRKRKMHPGFARAVLITIVGLSSLTPAVGQELELPTPLEHYESFDVEGEAEALGRDIFASLDPGARQTLFTQLGPGLMLGQGLSELTAPEVAALLEQIDLAPHRSRLLEVLLHSSHIMDTVPESLESWAPMVHDGLLLVLDGMSGQRLNERIAEQAALPQDAPRSERILSFITKTPAFQKLGQILARYEETAPDIREAFQTLENSIYTMQANEAVELVESYLGKDVIEEYDFQFEDYMVGEASVGAVIGATIVLPPETARHRVVCKVLKTYVIDAMEEDLVSVEKALLHLEAYGDFYGIGTSPLVEMFREVRDTLADEIRVEQEQDNLRRAFVYFQNVPEVDIPAVYPCSNSDVTVMERLEGVKVTEGFAGDPQGQRKLARRLADVLIYDVLFEKRDSMFHGDPHAGNVFYVGGEGDPYRIALLDWGLTGVLDKDRREKLVQVGLGIRYGGKKRLRNHIDALLEEAPTSEDERVRLQAVVDEILERTKSASGGKAGTIDLLNEIVGGLVQAGYSVSRDILLYTKSLITIVTVITDLDPDWKESYIEGRVTRQVLKETPKRLLNTVYIPGFWSHDYESMLSNADVWVVAFHRVGGGFAKLGSGIWKGISYPFRSR